jgi:hypothetical protein
MLNNNLLVLKNRTKAAAEPKFDIAGFPNSSDIVTTPPKILEANFLNSDDVFEIKTKVLALANEWQYLKYNSKSILSTRMLPPGRYARSSSQYKKDVAQYKNLMLDNFSRIYESIRLRLVEHFQVDLAYHSSTHYPGFHIFSLTEGNEYGEYNFYNFHQDVFPFLNKFIQCETVYSCVIPIELPNDNGSLLYVTSDKQSSGSHEKIQYRVGDLLIWQGNLIHSIEPFALQGDETRITMQFHVALSNDSGIIFW